MHGYCRTNMGMWSLRAMHRAFVPSMSSCSRCRAKKTTKGIVQIGQNVFGIELNYMQHAPVEGQWKISVPRNIWHCFQL